MTNDPTKTRVLYIFITKECELHCEKCYNKNKDNALSCKNIPIDSGYASSYIEKVYPDVVNFVGGDPLKYPQTIMDILANFRSGYPYHKFIWNVSSHFMQNEVSTKQLEMMHLIQDMSNDDIAVGTVYNTNKFNLKMFLDNFKRNVSTAIDNGIKMGLRIVLSPEFMYNVRPEKAYEFAKSLGFSCIKIERPIYSYSEMRDLKTLQKVYDQSDLYMKEMFEILPVEMNKLYTRYHDAIKYGYTIFNKGCSDVVFSLYDHGIYRGCPSNMCRSKDIMNNRLDMKTERYSCYQCKYFQFCGGDCECARQVCAFPKHTIDYMSDIVKKELKEVV